ncbi:MAG: hypothetical protein ACK4GN_00930 [Runella sp.]
MKNKSKKNSKNSFHEAVEATPDIANGYKTGLSALGTHSSKISVASTSLLEGSVDIDSCTSKKYPNSNRWDYVFSYKGEAYFIEVHSADSSEVRTVLNKLQWLKDWLTQHAPEINRLRAKNPFYWIQSKGFAIPKTSPQYRAASAAGIKPIAKLNLP